MNRAEQNALYQQTNIGILGIRRSEIQYYVNLNVAFGTQAALVGGFSYSVFSQTPLNYDLLYVEYFADVYWIMSTITIALSVHVIISTMMLQVLGPGLALYGPVGSMVNAAEGLKIEQKQIIYAFTWMMVLFAVSTIISFWVVMSYYSAAGSSVAFLVAARYWYYYSERIYLRFYWDAEKEKWNEDTGGRQVSIVSEHDDMGYHPPIPKVRSIGGPVENGKSSVASNLITQENIGKMNENDSRSSKKNKFFHRKRLKLFSSFPFHKGKKSEVNSEELNNVVANPVLTNTKESDNSLKTHHRVSSKTHVPVESLPIPYQPENDKNPYAIEGYLSRHGTSSLSNSGNEKWERCYCGLTPKGNLFFYKNRQHFYNNPKDPLNNRPLYLFDFFIVIHVEVNNRTSETSNHGDRHSSSTPPSPRNSFFGVEGKQKFVFEIMLFPQDSDEASQTVITHNHDKNPRDSFLDSYYRGTASSYRGSEVRPSGVHGSRTSFNEQDRLSRKRWLLRFDTEEELHGWEEVMRRIAPSCFKT